MALLVLFLSEIITVIVLAENNSCPAAITLASSIPSPLVGAFAVFLLTSHIVVQSNLGSHRNPGLR